MNTLSIHFCLLLCATLLCALLAQAWHADEPDCNDRSCLICHANADEESISLSQLFVIALPPPDLSFSHYESVHDKAPTILLPIRGPQSQERGDQ